MEGVVSQLKLVLDQIVSPVPATATLGTTSALNIIMNGLPLFINVMMAVYAVLVVGHKIYQIRKDMKKDAPKE